MVTFLRPLGDTLSKFADHGILVQPAELTSEPFVCKVLTIAGTCDLPAKALVLNSVQYNGKFECHKCEEPGETVMHSCIPIPTWRSKRPTAHK